MQITVINSTHETLTVDGYVTGTTSLPRTIASAGTMAFQSKDGWANLSGPSGAAKLNWQSPLIAADTCRATAEGDYLAGVGSSGERHTVTITQKTPPAPPPPPSSDIPSDGQPPIVLFHPPTPVTPTRPGSSATNTLNTADPYALRRAVVAKAHEQADAWGVLQVRRHLAEASVGQPGDVGAQAKKDLAEVASEERALRRKYMDATNQAAEQSDRQFLQGHGAPAWCGIFGAWTMNQGRGRDGIRWIMGPGVEAGKVLVCSDKAKLHRGDVAMLEETPEWYARYRAWESGDAKPEDKPGKVNHHVVIVDPSNDPCTIIQGNSGGKANAESVVTHGTVAKSRILHFYCAVPAASCVAKPGKVIGHPGCPVKDGDPCVLPDKP